MNSLQLEENNSIIGASKTVQSSSRACQRCRDQKLKCNRESPICSRCKRVKANCVYPNPSDRRRSRLQSSMRIVPYQQHKPKDQPPCPGRPGSGSTPPLIDPHRAFDDEAVSCNRALGQPTVDPRLGGNSLLDENNGQSANSPGELAKLSSESYPTHLRDTKDLSTNPTSLSGNAPLPPRSVGLFLFEIYFTRIYNATLIFHKPTIFQEYLEGKLPVPLLKAIFALASLFVLPINDGKSRDWIGFRELQAFNAYHSYSLPWAQSAMKESLILIVEQTSLPIIQALECLTVYWFGVGNPKNGDLCLALAYRSCCILGYNKKTRGDLDEPQLSLDSELKRRCLWSCWVSMCIVAEPQPYIRSAWSEMAMILLPSTIYNTNSGCKVAPGERMDANWYPIPDAYLSRDDYPPPATAAVVKIIGVWAKVQLFVDDCSSLPDIQRLERLSNLSGLATTVYRSSVFPIYRDNLKADASYECDNQILISNTIYHLCQITLHATIVPLFSDKPIDPLMDPETIKNSAHAVIQHADILGGILSKYSKESSDFTYLSPLVGHGAFITAVILLIFELSYQDRSINGGRLGNYENRRISQIEDIVSLLDTLRIYWKVLQKPWEKLSAALQENSFLSGRIPAPAVLPNSDLIITSEAPTPAPRSVISSFISAQSTSLSQEQCVRHVHDHEVDEPITQEIHQNMLPSSQPEDVIVYPTPAHGSDHQNFQRITAQPESMPISRVSVLEEDWWNLPFLASGNGQLIDLDPMNLLRQSWNNFS